MLAIVLFLVILFILGVFYMIGYEYYLDIKRTRREGYEYYLDIKRTRCEKKTQI